MPDAIHPLADTANSILRTHAPSAWNVLSVMGKRMYFPTTGTLGQTDDARGKRLNATIGIALEDDGSPMRLASIESHIALSPQSVFPYASSYGLRALRDAWREHILDSNPSLHAQISTPVVTGGLTHALSVAGMLLLDPQDALITAEPHWDNYDLLFEETVRTQVRRFPLFAGDGFNVEGLRAALGEQQGKAVVLLNFPNNPTGYTATAQEAAAICQVLHAHAEAGNDIAVICDDAYFGLVYETGIQTESFFATLASLHERILAVKIDGCSKEDFGWGLRVGYLTYAGKGLTPQVLQVLEDKTAGIVRGTVSSASHPCQSLLLAAYTSGTYEEEKRQKEAILRARYRRSKEILARTEFASSFRVLPCNSGYFLCLEVPEGVDAEQVRRVLLSEYSTGVIAFGRLIRVAFSSVPEGKLEELFTNIHRACQKFVPVPA